jgi:urease subunit alpha
LFNTCATFVSKVSLEKNIVQQYGLQKMILPVKNCRNISKKDLIHNDATPQIDVNPENYEVKVDGDPITCEPLAVLPLAQRYFLF